MANLDYYVNRLKGGVPYNAMSENNCPPCRRDLCGNYDVIHFVLLRYLFLLPRFEEEKRKGLQALESSQIVTLPPTPSAVA